MWQILSILVFTIFLNVLPGHSLPKKACPGYSMFEKQLGRFDYNLYSELLKSNPDNNIIISPFSIQICLAMARMGASGTTASEIDRILTSSDQDPKTMANYYHHILKQYENSPQVTVANKMYVQHNAKVQKKFNEFITKQFLSSAEEIDFGNNKAAAATINDWVSSKTHNLIQNVVSEDSLDGQTSLVLVNAIHFKGEWLYKFSEEDTKAMDFKTDKGTIQLPTMYIKGNFSFGYSPQYDARTLEMFYKDSDLSMLIILPKYNVALEDLERKMKDIPLVELTRDMNYVEDITVFLPKFKVEFEIDLVDPLKKMGMRRTFSDNANFKNMLMGRSDLHISSIIHKVVIEVNEQGAEAAAVTEDEFGDRIGGSEFNVNRPFHYIIRDRNAKLFEGNFKG